MLAVEKNNENRTASSPMLCQASPSFDTLSACLLHLGNERPLCRVWLNGLCRSLKTNRLFPTPNKPDPMPQNLAFLFTKITPEQMIYMPTGLHSRCSFCSSVKFKKHGVCRTVGVFLCKQSCRWNVLTAIFASQVLMVIAYCGALACFPDYWWTCTLCFGLPFSYIAIQKNLGRMNMKLVHVACFRRRREHSCV